eukprot:536275-Amphidinium_carterae.2
MTGTATVFCTFCTEGTGTCHTHSLTTTIANHDMTELNYPSTTQQQTVAVTRLPSVTYNTINKYYK